MNRETDDYCLVSLPTSLSYHTAPCRSRRLECSGQSHSNQERWKTDRKVKWFGSYDGSQRTWLSHGWPQSCKKKEPSELGTPSRILFSWSAIRALKYSVHSAGIRQWAWPQFRFYLTRRQPQGSVFCLPFRCSEDQYIWIVCPDVYW